MTAVDQTISGLPEWLIRKYLSELGAAAGEGGEPRVSGEGWSVCWATRREPVPGGAFELTQFDLRFEGEAEAVARVHAAFLKKAQRGGG